MPGFDGTGPLKRGPMTGRGMGFCVLKESRANPGGYEGVAGLQGVPINDTSITPGARQGKEVIHRPRGTGPLGTGFTAGRAAGLSAGHPIPGYANSGVGIFRFFTPAAFLSRSCRAGFYGYGMRYGKGFGFGRKWGRVRRGGRGRFGFHW